MFETDLDELSTADLLESAAEHRALANQADTRLLQHAQIYADRFHPSACRVRPGRPGRRSFDGRERAVVLGGDGCPEIAEFAIAEFGVVLGISPMVAARFLGEALALRHRFPFTWARVLAGDATPWKARQLASHCLKISEEAARYVDQRVASLIDAITPYRLDKIIRAAKTHADPDLARDETAEAASERGVFIGRSDHHGNKTIYAKAPAGAVIRHDATITAIAEALKTFGDTRHLQHRRADAIGIIADPRFTQELLSQAHNHPTPTTSTNTAAPAQAPSPAATAGRHPAKPGPEAAPGSARVEAASQSTVGARSATTGRGAFSSRDRSNHAPPTATDPARGGTTATPATRPCDGPQAGDAHLLHPVTDPIADPDADWVALREPPLEDGVGPYDPDPPSDPFDSRPPGYIPGPRSEPDDGMPMDTGAQRALDARLAQIKQDAHTNPATRGGQVRLGQTEVFVHLTDLTLATGTGVLRAEGIGPLLADQLTELVGHGPYTVKPVIDLNDAVSVDAYEIPTRIRERVRLTYPVELFPYGTRETHRTIDLDHIEPYDPYGPAGQTSTRNLAPLSRFAHRVKTHARGWDVRRVDVKTLEWTTPHGFTFEVGPTGTHRLPNPTTDN